jgi:hypothetical protein
MNNKILGILVCMLFIGAALPSISSTEKSTVNIAINPVTDIEAIKSMSYEECNCYNQTGKYGLGYLPLPDWVKPSPVEEPTVFLTELDWRSYTYNGVSGNWLTSVKNQGQCGSCWAFGAIGCLEAMINIAYINPNVDMDLSEQYMVSCVTSCSGCNGGNAYDCYKYMKDDTYPNDGALPESCFPYSSGSGSVPPCSNKCSDWKNKLVKKITNYGESSGKTQIKSRLSKGPVCLHFDVYEDFYDYTGGIYQHVYGDYRAGHQVVCVGYSDSGGYWICKNSWGSDWGESGYFKIKYGECSIESEMIYCDFWINLPPNTPSNPNPQNHAKEVAINTDVSWICSDPNHDTLVYDVYFGESGSLPKVITGQSKSYYGPGTLALQKKYNWKIVARDTYGVETPSPIWDFTTGSNSPPNTPGNPSPPDQAKEVNITRILSWTGGDPDVGDTVVYDVYFGTSSSPPLLVHNQSDLTYDPGTMGYSTKYYWKVISMDNHGASDNGSIWSFTTTNDPPNKPNLPSGEKSGKTGEEYTYTSNTSDSNDDKVYYLWDWADGNNSGWLGPYISGVTVSAKHIWETKGNYDIKVKAKDEHGAESNWSDPLPITMPYSYNRPILQFLELLFQRFPHAFPLLRYLMGY